jgi:protein gp37
MADDGLWKSWNPVTGCTKISAGCANCYAERIAKHVQNVAPEGKYRNGFTLTLHPEYLNVPLNYKSQKTFFVNSMSDLFHKDVPFEFILHVFNRMERAYWHSYRILTKRPQRMRHFINDVYGKVLPNLWIGTSIEDYRVKARIHELRRTHAKVKFVNFAPLIGPVGEINLENISWVFIGEERAPRKPRAMKQEWVDEIIEQCLHYKVPFYLQSQTIEPLPGLPQLEPQPQKTLLQFAERR